MTPYVYALAQCALLGHLMIFVLNILMPILASVMHEIPLTDTFMWIIWHLTPIFTESGAFCFHLCSKPIRCVLITFISLPVLNLCIFTEQTAL